MTTKYKFPAGLLKLGEEGCEVGQAILKAVALKDEYVPENNNPVFEKLVEEIGDVMAALDFFVEHAPTHFLNRVEQRSATKYGIFMKYRTEGKKGFV